MSIAASNSIETEVTPFDDQKPGTSGLRKKVARFQEPHYIETFVQAIFDTVPALKGGRMVLGGDGRFLNKEAIQIIIRMAAANGVGEIIVGQNGILSTPAASNLIRKRKAVAGIILSASHNPGGPNGDFGIKLNIDNGGPAPQSVTDALFARSKDLTLYRSLQTPDIDLSTQAELRLGEASIEIVDPVKDYADLMETQFDFAAIRSLAERGETMAFDGMHAVTGPYAREIFENRLGFSAGTVTNGLPLEDFGGGHPDPNLHYAKDLYELMISAEAPLFGAASDGDGDRNLIIGRNCPVSPSDSLAVLAEHAHRVPAYKDGLPGVARSMPTSSALDRVAQGLGIPVFETPTGWKFFGNLLDAGEVGLCGEESAGTGGAHVREKDGIWAVLFWLNILAATGQSVADLMQAHWQRFGRTFYVRHDFEGLEAEPANKLYADLAGNIAGYVGKDIAGLTVQAADVFEYKDPTNGEVAGNQGIRFSFTDGSRMVVRLSGTGTVGATLRIYMERVEEDPASYDKPVAQVLTPLVAAYCEILELERIFGVTQPTGIV